MKIYFNLKYKNINVSSRDCKPAGVDYNCVQVQVQQCKGVRRGRDERSQCDVISPSHCIPLYGPAIVVTLLPAL